MYSFEEQQTQLEDQIFPQAHTQQPFNIENAENPLDNDSSVASHLNFYPESQVGPTWQNSMLSYPYQTTTPAQYFDGNDSVPYQNGFYLHVANNIGEPWTKVMTTDGHINADMNGMAGIGLPFGAYENLGSLSGSTPTSPDSEGWILCPPPVVCTLDSEPMNTAFCEPYFPGMLQQTFVQEPLVNAFITKNFQRCSLQLTLIRSVHVWAVILFTSCSSPRLGCSIS
jgi:hypothetical protein